VGHQSLFPIVGPDEDHLQIPQNHHEVSPGNGFSRNRLEIRLHNIDAVGKRLIPVGLLIALVHKDIVFAE